MKYEAPEMKVIEISADVITASITGGQANGNVGGMGNED